QGADPPAQDPAPDGEADAPARQAVGPPRAPPRPSRATARAPGAARVTARRGRVLLDGAADGDGLGGWRFAAADPAAELEARGDQVTVRGAGGEVTWRGAGDPLEILEAMAREHGAGAPANAPVAIGWIGYEIGRRLHGLPPRSNPAGEPDLWFGFWGQAPGSQPLAIDELLDACDHSSLDDGD